MWAPFSHRNATMHFSSVRIFQPSISKFIQSIKRGNYSREFAKRIIWCVESDLKAIWKMSWIAYLMLLLIKIAIFFFFRRRRCHYCCCIWTLAYRPHVQPCIICLESKRGVYTLSFNVFDVVFLPASWLHNTIFDRTQMRWNGLWDLVNRLKFRFDLVTVTFEDIKSIPTVI